jgi:hypothetical protein
METAPGYYVWEVPGKPLVIHLRLEVVDRLGREVMRGFGAVPKRGGEVGGLLLGTIEPGDRTLVRIEDYQPVDCDYKRGPSYLFTDEDIAGFEGACERSKPGEGRSTYAVGYYRSHTREGLSLSSDDLELMDRYFPDPDQVALLVRPYGTKPSVGAFFVREEGVFPEAPPLEFPFRRRDLGSEEPPTGGESRPPRRLIPVEDWAEDDRTPAEPVPVPEPVRPAVAARGSGFRGTWVWVPLSLILVLLGGVLGYVAARTLGTNAPIQSASGFTLALSVSRSGDNLNVKWDRDAPAVRAAQKGRLEIEEGGYTKPVELDAAHLQGGGVIYRRSSGTVRFRLTVYLNARLSVTEAIEWRQ